MNAFRIISPLAMMALAVPASLAAIQPVTRIGERPIGRGEVVTFVGEQFAAADADKDGAVSQGELHLFRSRLDSRDQTAFDEMLAQSFDQADIDADGEIARWEVDQRAMQLFDMVDINRDDVASIEEQNVAAALANLEARDIGDLLGQFRSNR